MEQWNPVHFSGPQAYFTGFDHRIVRSKSDQRSYRDVVERRLKLLLLTKSRVVCAASHLATPFVFEIFKDNPSLLDGSHVVPALRQGLEGFAPLVEKKLYRNREEIVSFYNECVPGVYTWDIDQNSGWFRGHFVSGLVDDRSVVRQNLLALVSVEGLDEFIEKVAAHSGGFSREVVEDAAVAFPPAAFKLIRVYRELMYHISGARVVNCEGHLPQEEYLDYDLTTPTEARQRLTAAHVFWKLLLEQALESLELPPLPIEILDSLTFADIEAIREPLLDSAFQRKYANFHSAALDPLTDGRLASSALSVEELRVAHDELRRAFQAGVQKELQPYLRRRQKQTESSRGVLSNGVSVALGAVGLGPLAWAGVGGLLKDAWSLFMSLRRSSRDKSQLEHVSGVALAREQAMTGLLQRSQIAEDTEILDLVTLLTQAAALRVRVP